MPPHHLGTIAILNSNEDVQDIMRRFLNAEGFHAVSLSLAKLRLGEVEICAFMQEHDPQVIVYGISFPYEENWKQLQKLQEMEECANRDFIITTPNLDALRDVANGQIDAYQLIDQHTDLRRVVDAVKIRWNQKTAN